VVNSSYSPSVQVALNANTRSVQRLPQQASPAASTFSVAGQVPSFATQQACAAGPSKSGLPHTPAAQCRVGQHQREPSLQFNRHRCRPALPSLGERGACSGSILASLKVAGLSLLGPCRFVVFARLLASNAQLALPAQTRLQPIGRRLVATQRANPSVKGTSRKRAAPYLER
jgi:hypothetical protein